MKKLLSIVLALCICLTFGALLTGCIGGGGVDNPYANFLSSYHQNSHSEDFEATTGQYVQDYVNDNTVTKGNVNFYGTKGAKNSFGVYAYSVSETFKNEPGPSDDVHAFMDFVILYRADSNTLTVKINRFVYSTWSYEKESSHQKYDWKDGFAFNPPYDGTGSKDILILEYDVSKYFANDGFVPADASTKQDFDMNYLTEDHKGVIDTEHTFTERNANWKDLAIKHITSRVNATLNAVDDVIAEMQAK